MSRIAAPTTLSLCAALSKSAVKGRHAAGAAATAALRWARAGDGATTSEMARTATIARRTAFDRECGIAGRRAEKSEVITLL
jgi:hypothetical protein